jgi:hypothetical protein
VINISTKEIENIKSTVERAYIEGIHKTQDKETVLSGFHPDFTMFALNNNEISKISLNEWFPRIEELKNENVDLWKGDTKYKFHLIDHHANIAYVKLSVWKNNEYFSTDYMLLYKFDYGWRIVSKVFSFDREFQYQLIQSIS